MTGAAVLAPLGALALLALPAIVALYFLKVRRPELKVATLMLWRPHVLDRQANAPWQRLRASLLLILQLAAALAIALALLRPGLTGAAGVGSTTVVLLDGSPSMEATDVAPSRFGAAVAHVRDLAANLAPGQRLAIVLLLDHAQLLAPPTSDVGVLGAALRRAHSGGTPADLGEGISLADALLAGQAGGSILILSDGHAVQPPSPPRLAAPVTYTSFGNTGENSAIEAMTLAAGNNVFLRVADYGRQPRDLKLEMIADGRLVDVLPVRVAGNSSVDVTWNRLPAGSQVLEARLTPADAFALDDSAWLVTAAPLEHRVLLVTAGNAFLERALKLRSGIRLTTLAPKDYRPGDPYDLYVFDGFVPTGKLPAPALVVGPPQGEGPVPAGPSQDAGGVLPANALDPLLHDVSLRDVHVQVAPRVTVPPDWRVAVAATSGPLLLVHDGDPKLAELTFDLHHSDLPLRAGFPILLQNLVAYLLPGGFENQVYRPGAAVQLSTDPGARSVTVTRPDGSSATFSPPLPPYSDTFRAGVYTVAERLPAGVRTSRFVVELQTPSESRIQPGAAPVLQDPEKPRGPLPRGTLELWPYAAAAALLLLGLEWLVFLRGDRPFALRRAR